MMMQAHLFKYCGLASAGWSCQNKSSLSIQTAPHCRNLFHHEVECGYDYYDYHDEQHEDECGDDNNGNL